MTEIKEFSADMQEAVIQFLRNVFPESGKALEPEGRHAAFADIDGNFAGFWCLFDGEDLIGTAAVKKLDETVCELKAMYLYKSYHGMGLGRKLAETAISFAKKNDFGEMVLDTVSTYERAIRLYEKLGFRLTERYNDNNIADVFMALEL
ncbi:GNAT family N-acetyltransferase [Ruminococcus flavefaciens]|uniref:GNAT family N-acetyltransferase n=1 Tax=Ruminococcus flavefaciens TaxID=1265 RepID=UPI0026EE4A71|nr:GNAT family N-acetyltransferase [Ruminococcus flavefaciens]